MTAAPRATPSVRRGRPLVALVVILVTLGLVGAADVVADDPTDVAVPVETGRLGRQDAVSGEAVCAVGDARPGTATTVDVVRPGSPQEAPATAITELFADGSRETAADVQAVPRRRRPRRRRRRCGRRHRGDAGRRRR